VNLAPTTNVPSPNSTQMKLLNYQQFTDQAAMTQILYDTAYCMMPLLTVASACQSMYVVYDHQDDSTQYQHCESHLQQQNLMITLRHMTTTHDQKCATARSFQK